MPVLAAEYFLGISIVAGLLPGLFSYPKLAASPAGFLAVVLTGTAITSSVALAVQLVYAAISQAIGKALLGAKGDYWSTLGIYLYSGAAAMALSLAAYLVVLLLPDTRPSLYLFRVVIGLYILYVVTVGLSTVHGISMPRALLMNSILFVILLLILGAVASGLSYVWLANLQNSVMGETSSGLLAPRDLRLCMDGLYWTSPDISFTVKNCGVSDIAREDLAAIRYYVNNNTAQCDLDSPVPLKANDAGTVTCKGAYEDCMATKRSVVSARAVLPNGNAAEFSNRCYPSSR